MARSQCNGQQRDSGAGQQDGIQRPPFHLPRGGYLLQFSPLCRTGCSSREGERLRGCRKIRTVSAMGRGHCCQQALVWLCELMDTPSRASGCAGWGTGGSQGPALSRILSGQSTSQIAHGKPLGFHQVHTFRRGRGPGCG